MGGRGFRFRLRGLAELFFPGRGVAMVESFSRPRPPCVCARISSGVAVSIGVNSFGGSRATMGGLASSSGRLISTRLLCGLLYSFAKLARP